MLSSILLFVIANAMSPSSRVSRRTLESSEVKQDSFGYQACMSQAYPTDCNAVMSKFTMDSITSDPALTSGNVEDIQSWSEEVIGYYCCKLRTGKMEDLKEISFTFPQMCFNKNVKSALELVTNDLDNGLWIDLMLEYCPNLAVAEKYRHKSHFTYLYSLSVESEVESSEELKQRVIHDCQQGESNGDGLVDLTILFPKGNDGDWQHVVAFWGDKISEESFIDWMPHFGFSTWWTLTTQSEFSLLSGFSGYFQKPKKMQIHSGIRLTGLNKEAMSAKMKEISAEGKYDIMVNNCAHQVARIAQAGLGCTIRNVPFLLPKAIEVVGGEIGRSLSSEEIEVLQFTMDELPEDSFLTSVTRRLFGSIRRSLLGSTGSGCAYMGGCWPGKESKRDEPSPGGWGF